MKHIPSGYQVNFSHDLQEERNATPTSVYWKDDNVKYEGAPDPRTVQFRPGRKPGIHLGRLSRYFLFLIVVNNFAH
jgi:hypothetical protein